MPREGKREHTRAHACTERARARARASESKREQARASESKRERERERQGGGGREGGREIERAESRFSSQATERKTVAIRPRMINAQHDKHSSTFRVSRACTCVWSVPELEERLSRRPLCPLNPKFRV
jgi:hypothetical protein